MTSTKHELSEERLAEIEARATAATPGPWYVSREDEDAGDLTFDVVAGHETVAHVSEGTRDMMTVPLARHDTAFIAHAREDVPALVAALRAAESRANDAERGLSQIIAQRDYYHDEIDRLARLVGCEEDLSNTHAHATCIDDAIAALEARALRLRRERDDLRALRASRDDAYDELAALLPGGDPLDSHASRLASLRRLVAERDTLRLFALRSSSHLYRGHCPEYDGDPDRDPECPVCAMLPKP